VQITEPMTMVTDYVLALLCLALGVRLARRGAGGQRSVRWFAASFLTTGLAAATGGTVHGRGPLLPDPAEVILWKLTVLAIGATAFLFLSAAAWASLRPPIRRLMLMIASIQFAGYAAWMLWHDDFVYVIYDYVPAMLVVLAIQYLDRHRNPASTRWVAAGILLSFLAAAIQQSGLTLHPSFNHNDVYHVVQMAAVLVLARGGAAMQDRPDAAGRRDRR